MTNRFFTLIGFVMFFLSTQSFAKAVSEEQSSEKELSSHPTYLVKTDSGNFKIELYSEAAPITVENFLGYVESGFYTHTIFHRIIPGFMIQGGGYTPDYKRKPTRPTIKNEATNGLSNAQYTLAMARTGDPDSASAQFFINVVNNPHLDKNEASAGYAVFGKVISGFEVLQKMLDEPQGLYRDFPNAPNYFIRILDIAPIE